MNVSISTDDYVDNTLSASSHQMIRQYSMKEKDFVWYRFPKSPHSTLHLLPEFQEVDSCWRLIYRYHDDYPWKLMHLGQYR